MIKIYGDSHSRIFKKIHLNKYKLDVENVSGASLSGLPKSNSKLKLRSKIFTYLKKNNPDFLILKFGQVDMDLGYYYKLVVKDDNINKTIYIENLIEKYINFLNEISKFYDKEKIIIFGINPPTLIDNYECYKYTKNIILKDITDKKKRKDLSEKLLNIIENIHERTNLSKLFNLTLKYNCELNNIKYNEVFNEFLNSKHIIASKFTTNTDHHLMGVENDHISYPTTNNLFKTALIKSLK